MNFFEPMRSAVQGFHDSLLTLIHDKSNVRVVMVQMPALNTPQFRRVKSRLPRKAQPVPPIFQPEVAADAIVWAAYCGRREVNAGWPATKAIVGNNIARVTPITIWRSTAMKGK